MYVNDRLGLVYIKIPKTSGTAVLKLVESSGFFRPLLNRFAPLSMIPDAYLGYRVFAVVRNPYYRMISMYRFDCLTRGRMIGFLDFLRSEERPVTQSMSQYEFIQHDSLRCELIRYEDDPVASVGRLVGVSGQVEHSRDTHFLGQYNPKEWSDRKGIDYITEHYADDFKLGYVPMTWKEL